MVKGARAAVVVVLAFGGPIAGCASTTPTVKTTPQPPSVAGVPVPFPPPPARVEVIPLRQRDSCKWRDGYWEFRAGEWQWSKGVWLNPAADGCAYAAPATRFESTPAGTALVYRASAWFDVETGASCVTPAECTEATGDSPAP